MNGAGIVGDVAAELIRAEFARSVTTAGERPAVMVRSFEEEEVVALVQALKGFRLSNESEPVDVRVGTTRDVPGLGGHCLEAGRTLTSYRNNNRYGLVLVELDTYSDAQGLANIRTIDDETVLDRDLGDELMQDRLRTIVAAAWSNVQQDRGGEHPPEQLVKRVVDVHGTLARLEAASLRRWVRFVATATAPLALEAVSAHSTVDRAVGGALPALGLFPDVELFSEQQAMKRRLQVNFQVAQRQGPTGKDISEEELIDFVAAVELPAELLGRWQLPDEAVVRQWMRDVAEGGGDADRSRIPLDVWLELFKIRTTRESLGSRVRRVFGEQFTDRVQEFDDLAIETALDNGEQEAAERLLRAEPPAEERPLVDLLPHQLRRRVEKLAIPRAMTEADPLRAILYGLEGLERGSDGEMRSVTLCREAFKEGEGRLSVGLFAFIYGPALSEVSALSHDGLGARLEVEPSLVQQIALHERLPDEDDDTPFDLNDLWAPLRLALRVDGQLDALHRFQWRPLDNPGLAAFALVVQTGIEPIADPVAATLDGWCQEALEPATWRRLHSLPGPQRDDEPGLVGKWLSRRREVFDTLTERGVEPLLLSDYIEWWADLLLEARVTLVPRNAPLPELERFLDIETIALTNGRVAMLGTHPLRLRWLHSHFDSMGRRILASLEAGLLLNEENDQLFFEWLDRVSPHRQPAFISAGDQTLEIPIREYGLHEEYAPIQQAGTERRDWLAGIDEASIDAVGNVIRSYLDAYPHKADGLSVLLLLRDGDPLVASRLVKRVRAKEHAGARVELHVTAPRRHHDRIAREIETLSTTDSPIPQGFLPDVQLVLHDWADTEEQPDLTHLADAVDVAVAPNLFGTKTSAQPSTRRAETGLAGHFDPWVDPTSHDLHSSGGSITENVSRVLLPPRPDPPLEAWSTLSVRRYRNAPVSPDDDASTDYLSLQIQFHAGVPLFQQLHAAAHWVVTLDPFVGRDQIDALEARPDVILVRAGIGKNETYTLVVSSTTGSRFVTQRLARKLRHDFRLDLDRSAEAVAQRVYEVGRNTLPSVILRALGLGRSAEEMVGLITSRYAVEEAFPAPPSAEGFEWWISLDEHTDWSGGAQRVRADLLRVLGLLGDDGLSLRLHVVEAKFRGTEDIGVADQQLSRTISLLRGALHTSDDDSEREPDDAIFWRRELVQALEQTSKQRLDRSELPALRALGRTSVPELDLRGRLLSGAFRVDELIGIAVAIAYDEPTAGSRGTTPQDHHLLRIFRPELTRILERLVNRLAPEQLTSEIGPIAPARQQADDAPVSRETEGGAPVSEPVNVSGEPTRRGLTGEELDDRYRRMLDVFASHNVRVLMPEADRTDQGPGFYVLRVVPEVGVSVDRLTNRVDDLKLALHLEASQQLRAYIDRGVVVLEVPKSDNERYEVIAQDVWAKTAWRHDALFVPIGEDIHGNVVGVEFSSPDSPHLLVGGATGSGKSVLIETILRGLLGQYAAEDLRLFLIDPKGTELVDFDGDPHVEGPIGMDAEDALLLLEQAVAEMQRRYDLLKQNRVRSIVEFNQNRGENVPPLPWWLIVLDEYADLTSDPDDKTAIERLLKRLAQKARAAGIHLLVATQKPSAEVISTTVRSNLPAQVALRVRSAADSRIIMDESGAETLAGKGDAFIKTVKGVIRLQCAWYSPRRADGRRR